MCPFVSQLSTISHVVTFYTFARFGCVFWALSCKPWCSSWSSYATRDTGLLLRVTVNLVDIMWLSCVQEVDCDHQLHFHRLCIWRRTALCMLTHLEPQKSSLTTTGMSQAEWSVNCSDVFLHLRWLCGSNRTHYIIPCDHCLTMSLSLWSCFNIS